MPTVAASAGGVLSLGPLLSGLRDDFLGPGGLADLS